MPGIGPESPLENVWTQKPHFALLPVVTDGGRWCWFKRVHIVKKFVGTFGLHFVLDEVCFMEQEELTAKILKRGVKIVAEEDILTSRRVR